MRIRFPFFLAAVLIPLISFGADAPENLGLGLRELVENYQTDQVQFRAAMSSAKTVQADAADRLAVNIHLNGTRRLEDVRKDLEGLGLEIIDADPTWRSGVISAWLPISQATAAAELPGVRSVMLAPPPRRRVGSVSTRALVQTGDKVMIGGFIITGSDPTNVLVRALGPSLTAFGVAGALPDPTIELHDGQGNLLMSNDNWQQDSLQATQIQATGLAPGNAVESALLVTLNASGYTAIVRGANGTTGVGLVEVYNLK